MTTASIKDELHELIDAMDPNDIVRLWAMIGNLQDDGTLTLEEEADLLEGIAAVERGEVISETT